MPSFLPPGHKAGVENTKEDLGLIPIGKLRDFNQFEVDDAIYFKEENPCCSKYEFGDGLYIGRNIARYDLFYFCTCSLLHVTVLHNYYLLHNYLLHNQYLLHSYLLHNYISHD